jgi:hypothetical protein
VPEKEVRESSRDSCIIYDGEQIIPPLMPNQIQAQRNDAVTHGEADYLVGLS